MSYREYITPLGKLARSRKGGHKFSDKANDHTTEPTGQAQVKQWQDLLAIWQRVGNQSEIDRCKRVLAELEGEK